MTIQTRNRALSFMAAALLFAALVVAWGSRRYDGAENFGLRISAELQARRPHPEFAPTPWSSAADPGQGKAPAFAIAAPSPAPTATASLQPVARPATPTRPATVGAPNTSGVKASLVAAGRQDGAAGDSRVPRTPAEVSTPVVPSPTATRPSSLTPTPAAALPARVQLEGLRHNWQTWNNCGPATLAMQLSYFGSQVSQGDVAAVLRPYRDDKNVNPDEMAAYARSQGMGALVRVDGDAERLKRLLTAGLPVLIETWYEPKPNDGMGHYRLLVGYDDAASEWIAYDSYDGRGLKKGDPYRGIRLSYDEVARLWETFNRTYVVLYDDARAAEVESILGEDLDDAGMWTRALETARATVQTQPKNAFAWFNAGSSLVALGRHEEAAWAFDQARRVGLPWRMLWYQHGPFQAYFAMERYDEIIALANATLRNAQIEELFYWRGLAQQAIGDTVAAQASLRRALELNPNYGAAKVALESLSPSIS